jgi:hypothetical protein
VSRIQTAAVAARSRIRADQFIWSPKKRALAAGIVVQIEASGTSKTSSTAMLVA